MMLVLLTTVSSISGQPVSFRARQDFAVGLNPYFLAVGDFNGDGRLDMVAANISSNTVSVLIGYGDGTFQHHVDYATGPYPSSVAVGDFLGNGILDLAVANETCTYTPCPPGTVSILLGNTNGTFTLQGQSFGVDSNPISIVVGDFNHDGKPDLAVSNMGTGTISILTNQGPGCGGVCFVTQPSIAVPGGIERLAVGDFNGDGWPDLAVANTGANAVTVLINKTTNPVSFVGLCTGGAYCDYAVGAEPTSVAVADLNGDGFQDLAVVNTGSNNVSVLLGTGSGTFGIALGPYKVGSFPDSIAVGDFNGDGKPDLIVPNNGSDVSLLLGNGNGTFKTKRDFSTGILSGAVVVGDFNGDRKLDAAVANGAGNSNNVSVLLGTGTGSFRRTTDLHAGSTPVAVVAADFNGDGKPDLAVANNGSNNISVFLHQPTGGFNFFLPAANYPAGGSGPFAIAVGDFNNDGIPDLVVANESGSVSVLLGSGSGTFTPLTPVPVGRQFMGVAVGDFNGDGKLDVAVTDNGVGVWVLLGNGDGTFQSSPAFYAVSGAGWGVAVGDLNGDGNLDLAIGGNASSITVLLGNGSGTFLGSPYTFPVGLEPLRLAIADFNGDGKPDLAVANCGSSNISVLINNSLSPGLSFLPAMNYDSGNGNGCPVFVAVGDFNRDGKLDLAVANANAANVSVFLGNGDGTFDGFYPPTADFGTWGAPFGIAVADFNGDGKPDMAITDYQKVALMANTTP
jgi:hypothetical protein